LAQHNLRIAGINVGRELPAPEPYAFIPSDIAERGSIIVVVATDAPLLAHQLKRVAHRVTLGLGRNGSISGNDSGDIFIAFSTANPGAAAEGHVVELKMLPHAALRAVLEKYGRLRQLPLQHSLDLGYRSPMPCAQTMSALWLQGRCVLRHSGVC